MGERIKGQMIVRAQLNGVNTQLGEWIVVFGDCPELGNWDIAKGYPLEYINAYKYVLLREGQSPTWENLVARRWLLTQEGIVKWRDQWAG